MTTEFSSETMEDPNNSTFLLVFFFKCWKNCVFIEEYLFKKEDDIKTLSDEEKLWIIFHWTCSKFNAKGSSLGWRGMVCVCVYVCVYESLSYVQLFATLWTVANQTPLLVEFSRQEYWSRLPVDSLFSRLFSRPWDQILVSCIAGGFFTAWATRKAWGRMVLEGNLELC